MTAGSRFWKLRAPEGHARRPAGTLGTQNASPAGALGTQNRASTLFCGIRFVEWGAGGCGVADFRFEISEEGRGQRLCAQERRDGEPARQFKISDLKFQRGNRITNAALEDRGRGTRARERGTSANGQVSGSRDVGRLEFASCGVANVEHYDLLLFFEDAEDHAIDVGLPAV